MSYIHYTNQLYSQFLNHSFAALYQEQPTRGVGLAGVQMFSCR